MMEWNFQFLFEKVSKDYKKNLLLIMYIVFVLVFFNIYYVYRKFIVYKQFMNKFSF